MTLERVELYLRSIRQGLFTPFELNVYPGRALVVACFLGFLYRNPQIALLAAKVQPKVFLTSIRDFSRFSGYVVGGLYLGYRCEPEVAIIPINAIRREVDRRLGPLDLVGDSMPKAVSDREADKPV